MPSDPRTETIAISNETEKPVTPGILEIFRVYLMLGLTAFGGPVAHFGFYRTVLVERHRWIDERAFADLIALTQFLPGPASSQTAIAIAMMQRGWAGGIAAWIGFTLPAAIIMIALGFGVSFAATAAGQGIVHGLKLAAVAVVLNALWGMARNACDTPTKASFTGVACVVMLFAANGWLQIAVIGAAALAGALMFANPAVSEGVARPRGRGKLGALAFLAAFAVLLVGLPVLAEALDSANLRAFAGFFRVGSLVFGGGHVVLPLLKAEVVPTGWTTTDIFLAGYGAAQAIPGPIFAIAGYLGNVITPGGGYVGGWIGGALATLAIFAPSFLLLGAALPHWERLPTRPGVRAALTGVNAAVVGLLLAVLYDPVWTSSVTDASDFATVVVAAIVLALWKFPPWLVVLLAAVAGFFGV
jgi:chromate transporter